MRQVHRTEDNTGSLGGLAIRIATLNGKWKLVIMTLSSTQVHHVLSPAICLYLET